MGQFRRERVQERVREILNTILRVVVRDPRLDGCYVTNAVVSADLRLAKVYWRSEAEAEEVVAEALSRSKGFLRSALAKDLGIKYSPDLAFYHDGSLERGAAVTRILHDLDQEEE
jgi:ribosome-binding factor A